MLAHSSADCQIFVGVVDSIYYDNNETFYHRIIVKERFRGVISDTILFLQSESPLTKNFHYLLFTRTLTDLYGMFSCHPSSTPVHHPDDSIEVNKSVASHGRAAYYDAVKAYFSLEIKAYTGEVQIKIKDKIIAKGQMLNGNANGNWYHYHYAYFFESLKSKVRYVNGMKDGAFVHYHFTNPKKHEGSPFISTIEYFKNDDLSKTEFYHGDEVLAYSSEVKRINEGQNLIIGETFDPAGNLSSRVYSHSFGPAYRKYNYQHGPYFRNYYNEEGSKKTNRIVTGNYYHNAKVGLWQTFDTSMVLFKSEIYPFPDTSNNFTKIYDEKGLVKFEGKLIDGIPDGTWNQYCDSRICAYTTFMKGKKEGEEKTISKYGGSVGSYLNGEKVSWHYQYKPDGSLSSKTLFDKNLESKRIVYYANKKQKSLTNYHAGERINETQYHKNGKIKSSRQFANRYVHGLYEEFHEDGSLKLSGHYFHGHKTEIWNEYLPQKDIHMETSYELNLKGDKLISYYPLYNQYDSRKIYTKVFVENLEVLDHEKTYPKNEK